MHLDYFANFCQPWPLVSPGWFILATFNQEPEIFFRQLSLDNSRHSQCVGIDDCVPGSPDIINIKFMMPQCALNLPPAHTKVRKFW